MPARPMVLTKADELIVVTNKERKGLKSITTKKPLRLLRTRHGPEVSVERGVCRKDHLHLPITLVLTSPFGHMCEFRFKEQVPVAAVLHNRLFDLASFAQDPMICVSGYPDILILALSEVLKDGTLSFRKHKKTVLVRYSLGTLRYHARIPCNVASMFFDGL